jgi:hypothetical protein
MLVSLKNLLRDQSLTWEATGGQPSSVIPALRTYRSRLLWLILLHGGLVLVSAVVGILMAISALPAGGAGGTAVSAVTATLVGCFATLFGGTWSSWSRAGLILALVDDASEREIRAIILKLVEKL